ncbi:MAG TPA: hypothetical protein VGH13_04390 [Xanthobacteraceae bacterium]|jgi:hypothetical protein
MPIKGAKKLVLPWFAQTPTQRLNGMKKAYELSGTLWALHDALELISHLGRSAPKWVVEGAAKVVRDRIQNGKPIAKGGPGANETSKKLLDMKHFYRWQVAKRLMKKGMPQTSAFHAAVPHLAAKQDTISWTTVRDSYTDVEADWSDPVKRQKYYSPMFEWLAEFIDEDA